MVVGVIVLCCRACNVYDAHAREHDGEPNAVCVLHDEYSIRDKVEEEEWKYMYVSCVLMCMTNGIACSQFYVCCCIALHVDATRVACLILAVACVLSEMT